jgi:hypothetical protein
METTLVIIDMQSGEDGFFTARDPATIRHVIRQVEMAKRHNWGIIVVEYMRHGRTEPKIMNKLISYERWTRVRKYRDDGSKVILTAAAKNQFEMKRFRVCGVNINACVFETTMGLAKKAEVHVVKHACNASYCGWGQFNLDNVVLIPKERKRK